MNTKKSIFIFILLPACINLLCIALYFSGIEFAQQLVAPTISWLPQDSWREMGILEQLQNIYLLAMLLLFITAAINRTELIEKIFFVVATVFTLFLLLEEMDYGLHYYELITGEHSGIEVRNWHNEETNNKQNVRYLKRISDIMMATWFVILPLFNNKIKNELINSIIPSRWFIGTFFTAIIMGKLAHFFQDNDFGIINGIQGNLDGNITEYREASNYYLYLLYAIQLSKTRLFTTHESD